MNKRHCLTCARNPINAPEDWASLPGSDCDLLGLSRTILIDLCTTEAIRFAVIHNRETHTSVWMVNLPYLKKFLARAAAGNPCRIPASHPYLRIELHSI